MKTKLITTLFATAFLVPMFVSAQATTTVNTITPPVIVNTPSTFTVCSQTAIEKRDTAISVARTAYNTSTQSALTARKEAFKQAVALATSTDKVTAKKEAIDIYKVAQKTSQTTYSTARKLAWSTYETGMRYHRWRYLRHDQSAVPVWRRQRHRRYHRWPYLRVDL